MTQKEAVQALLNGKTLTHSLFEPHEYVKSDQFGQMYTTEDGVEISSSDFWRLRFGNSIWADEWEEWMPTK